MKLGVASSLVLTSASVAGFVYAPRFAGPHAPVLKAVSAAGAIFGLVSLLKAVEEAGGLLGLVGGGLLAPQPVAELEPEGPVAPDVKPSPVKFLNVVASIVSPAHEGTLHARGDLLLRGTYPIVLELRNDDPASVRGHVEVEVVEDTIFGPPTRGVTSTPDLDLAPRTTRRVTVNVDAASGRASAAINVHAVLHFVTPGDGRRRHLATLDFTVF